MKESQKKNFSFENFRNILCNSFILELWYQHRTAIVEITYKIWTFFKTLATKKATSWQLKKPKSKDKLLRKIMSSKYHME